MREGECGERGREMEDGVPTSFPPSPHKKRNLPSSSAVRPMPLAPMPLLYRILTFDELGMLIKAARTTLSLLSSNRLEVVFVRKSKYSWACWSCVSLSVLCICNATNAEGSGLVPFDITFVCPSPIAGVPGGVGLSSTMFLGCCCVVCCLNLFNLA